MKLKASILLLASLIGSVGACEHHDHDHAHDDFHDHEHHSNVTAQSRRYLQGGGPPPWVQQLGFGSEAEFRASGARCGAPKPTAEEAQAIHDTVLAWVAANKRPDHAGNGKGGPFGRFLQSGTTYTIPVYWHIIRPTGGSNWNKNPIDSINALNTAFAPWGFQFNLVSTETTFNTAWYYANYQLNEDVPMFTALKVGGANDLNIYSNIPKNNAGNLLGYARLPSQYASAPTKDGVVIHEGSVPGGSLAAYNQGYVQPLLPVRWVICVHGSSLFADFFLTRTSFPILQRYLGP